MIDLFSLQHIMVIGAGVFMTQLIKGFIKQNTKYEPKKIVWIIISALSGIGLTVITYNMDYDTWNLFQFINDAFIHMAASIALYDSGKNIFSLIKKGK
jgi:hypothetical protein